MKRIFLCSILPLLLVVQSKKYLVEVDDGWRYLKNMKFSNNKQDQDKVSDEVSDEVEEEFLEEEDIEETLIESRGKDIISIQS